MKSTKSRKPSDEKEPHLLKVIRGEAPSIFFDNGFKPPERDSLSDSIEWLGRRARERREIKDLRAEVDQLKKGVREPAGKPTPEGFKGLGQKKTDLSKYLNWAKLTDVQRDCISMKFEYGLPLAEIARRMRKHHSTVQYHIARGTEKMKQSRAYESRSKRRSIAGAE